MGLARLLWGEEMSERPRMDTRTNWMWWRLHCRWNALARKLGGNVRPNFWWRVNHWLAARWLGPTPAVWEPREEPER